MKISELSIMELKAYFDLINEKIKRLNIDIEINGGKFPGIFSPLKAASF